MKKSELHLSLRDGFMGSIEFVATPTESNPTEADTYTLVAYDDGCFSIEYFDENGDYGGCWGPKFGPKSVLDHALTELGEKFPEWKTLNTENQ